MLVVLLLIPAVLIGCGGPKIKADESAKILFNFFVKGDKSDISKIALNQSTISKLKKSEKSRFNGQLLNYSFSKGNIMVDVDECNRIYVAYKNSLKHITLTSKVVSSDSKTSTVSVKTNYIDLPAIEENAQKDAAAKVKSMGLTNNTNHTDLSASEQNDALAKIKSMGIENTLKEKQELEKAYIDELEKDLNAAKPGTATKEKTFKFVLKDNNWLPEDSSDYVEQIEDMVSNQ